MANNNRSEKFLETLNNLTDEDKDRLVELEKATRLFVHVWELIGEADEKLVIRLRDAMNEVKNAYESK